MTDFNRLKKNIYIINIHLANKKQETNMIENFTQNNHGVSTINQVTKGYINAAGSDEGTELCDKLDQDAEPSTDEHRAYLMKHFDSRTRSMLEDFPHLGQKKQLKVLTFMEDVKLAP